MSDRPPPCTPELHASLAAILDAYGRTWAHVVSPARPAAYIPCRRAIYWLLHCRGWSSLRIGRFCHRDHTSILYALGKVNSHVIKQHHHRT
jgi:chromosomal replication initiation ATPase DnaA